MIREPAEVLGALLKRDWATALLFAPVYGLYEDGARQVAASFPCVPYAAPTDFSLALRMAESAAHGWVEATADGLPVEGPAGGHEMGAGEGQRVKLRYWLGGRGAFGPFRNR